MTRALATGGMVAAVLAAVIAMLFSTPGSSTTAEAVRPGLEVEHRPVGGYEDVGVGDEVPFVVMVTNRSCTRITDLTITIDLDEEIFVDLELDPRDGTSERVDGWEGVDFESCEEATFRYVATVSNDFGLRTTAAVTTAIIADASNTRINKTSTSLPLRRPADHVELNVDTEAEQRVSPGGSIDYTISVTNGGPAPVDDLVVRLPINRDFFATMKGSDLDHSSEIGDRLVWRAPALDPDRDALLDVGAVTVDRFAATSLDPVNVEVEAGGSRRVQPVSLGVAAAPAADLAVGHRTVESEVTIEPGQLVEYLITLTNEGESGAPLRGIEIVVTPDAAVFDPATLDGVGEEVEGRVSDGSISWMVDLVDRGQPVDLRYQVKARASFLTEVSVTDEDAATVASKDDVTVTNLGTVSLGGEPQPANSAPAKLGGPLDALEVTHIPSGDIGRVAPGDVVLYTVTIRNRNAVARIDQIAFEVGLDDRVFASPRRLIDESTGDLRWADLSLEGGEQVKVQYEATAQTNFPDGVDTTSNTSRISVGDLSAESEPSVALTLMVAPASGGDDASQLLGDWQRFALIVIFMLVTFVSGGLLVGRSSAGDDGSRRQLGILLFTTMSLVAATLILAFGTDIGDQALSLLAAIAGYVLGRRLSDDEPGNRPDLDPGAGQALGLMPAAPGNGPASAETGTATPSTEGVGPVASAVTSTGPVAVPTPSPPAGPVATSAHEWRRARQERRPAVLAAFALAMVSPVAIVLSTLWLIDSTNDGPIARGTYFSAAALSTLLVLFVLFAVYLLSEATGPGGTVGQRTERRESNDGETGPGDGDG